MNIETFPKFIGVGYDIEINNTPFFPKSNTKLNWFWCMSYIKSKNKLDRLTSMQEENMRVKKIKTINGNFIPCEYHYNN